VASNSIVCILKNTSVCRLYDVREAQNIVALQPARLMGRTVEPQPSDHGFSLELTVKTTHVRLQF